MYVPTNVTIIGGIPITAVDLSLHTFLGISWMILLPYTIFGIALMAYSQTRLMRGERKLKQHNNSLDAIKTITK